MRKKLVGFALIVAIIGSTASSVFANTVTHTVTKGDSMWLISKVHNLKLDTVIKWNPQVKNPCLIYPGQDITLDLSR